MAQRHRYGINFQTVNGAGTYEVVPIGYHEVAPGDSVSGTVDCGVITDTTIKPLMNRAYLDTFAFYVPFRLLASSWPDFITGEGNPPVNVTDLFPQNFETYLAFGSPTANSNAPWLRLCYNKVHNTFFRTDNFVVRPERQTGLGYAAMRPTTFHESIWGEGDVEETAIQVVDNSFTVNELREGFSADRWQKIRGWYGNKYTDYLRAHGVEASWSVLEEPELIGQKHTSLPYKMVSATANTEGASNPDGVIGQPAGYWQGNARMNIRKTYCPEHGLIACYAAVRVETQNIGGQGHPLLDKISAADFWSPQYTANNNSKINARLLGSGNSVDEASGSAQIKQAFGEYRVGANQIGFADQAARESAYFGVYNQDEASGDTYRVRLSGSLNQEFQGILCDGAHQLQTTTKVKLAKDSSVQPFTIRGVS